MTLQLCTEIGGILKAKGVAHTINRIGSMFTLFFSPGAVTDYDSALKCDTQRYAAYFRQMLEAGIYLPPSQFEANFLSIAHTDAQLSKTLAAVKKLNF
jgi:glutamate-1-semialdehyde 2,1-aminomutase